MDFLLSVDLGLTRIHRDPNFIAILQAKAQRLGCGAQAEARSLHQGKILFFAGRLLSPRRRDIRGERRAVEAVGCRGEAA
jgi:hypothetical protein